MPGPSHIPRPRALYVAPHVGRVFTHRAGQTSVQVVPDSPRPNAVRLSVKRRPNGSVMAANILDWRPGLARLVVGPALTRQGRSLRSLARVLRIPPLTGLTTAQDSQLSGEGRGNGS